MDSVLLEPDVQNVQMRHDVMEQFQEEAEGVLLQSPHRRPWYVLSLEEVFTAQLWKVHLTVLAHGVCATTIERTGSLGRSRCMMGLRW